MKLRFTPAALAELDDTLSYVRPRSPHGADRVQARLHATLDLLLLYPESERGTRLPGLRRIAANPYPYVVFYDVSRDAIVAIAIRDAARDPDSMPDGEET
ncbi:type II toxin-antitoxin system RelE/ParE family toxin [Methylobacterium sp. WL120]|uniref:type II toxin-antitoxin system RelE/ParE family toxin n=1 Tax=Methylobacterium sp. WL120 TaxID=2603887 RepID=UPI001FED98E1|nr:type II toxin-antitoxin system RelE/ParE family toxin [Methylobacterium sp. WL120]